MLTKLALIYVVLAGLESLYRIIIAIEAGVFSMFKLWFIWSINISGLAAVFAFSVQRRLLPAYAWLILLFSFFILRATELIQNSLFIDNVSLHINFLIALRYVWLVVPSLLALIYCAFLHRNNDAR